MPGILTANELAALQAAYAQTLSQTATINRLSLVNGLRKAPYVQVATGVAVDVLTPGGGGDPFRTAFAQLFPVLTAQSRLLVFPWGTDVAIGDEVLVGSYRYELLNLNTDEAYQFAIVASANEVEN